MESKFDKLAENQLAHILLLSFVTFCFCQLGNYNSSMPEEKRDFIFGLLLCLIHQIYITIVWRLELHNQTLTKMMGKYGLKIHSVIYFILLLGRNFPALYLGIIYPNTLSFNIGFATKCILCALLIIPFILTINEYFFTFGIERASGADHFKVEEYRSKPLIKKGIYKYFNNCQYIFGVGGFYCIGIWYESWSSLVYNAFDHITTFIHFYCTERPDMRTIYSNPNQHSKSK